MKHQIVFVCLVLAIGAKAAPEPKLDTFIINGTVATASPSYVHVSFLNAANLGFFGGGNIISVQHVLTGANIIVDFVSWSVGFGSTNANLLTRTVSTNAIAHPNYNALTRANDIGIITLPIALVLSPTVQPIALPQVNQVLPFDFEQGRIYGFGFSVVTGGSQAQFLQMAYQRVIIHTQCTASYPNAQTGLQFCANDLIRSSNICSGDFGGGFIVPYRGVDVIVGIASQALQQCNTLNPALYTRVSNYRLWIRQITAI